MGAAVLCTNICNINQKRSTIHVAQVAVSGIAPQVGSQGDGRSGGGVSAR